MNGKAKHGKERLDKYYHLAKEQGYRARSAFKILQLAKKFNIFENCNVLVDLCAAPGGWLQVAAKQLPVSSIIIGVDLVPIRPIKGVVTIQADIRTPRCRNLISHNLKGSEVDVVLHDGAPNVGANWNLDAFNQNVPVLEAAKLAAHVLKKGGIFVTKIFRSADYNSLMWMLGKCFERVKVTKPSSSRNVSAEIFAVCFGFKTLKGLDPKLFNCEHVFISQDKEDEPEPVKVTSLNQLLKNRKKVNKEGYEAGDDFREHSVLDFLTSDNPPQMLVSTSRFVFKPRDNGGAKDAALIKSVLGSPLTTDEVKLLCSDLKVAGRADLQHLLKWRQKLQKELFPATKGSKRSGGSSASTGMDVDKVSGTDGSDGPDAASDDEEAALRKQQLEIAERLRKEQRRSERKKRRALMKHKKAKAGGTSVILGNDPELFSLSALKGRDFEAASESGDSASDPEDDMILVFETDSEASSGSDVEKDKVADMDVDLEVQHAMSKLAEAERVKPAKKLTRRQRVNMERGAELSSLLENMQYEARLKAQQEQEEDSDESSESGSDHGSESGSGSEAGSGSDADSDYDPADVDGSAGEEDDGDDAGERKGGHTHKGASKPSSPSPNSAARKLAKEAQEDAVVDRWFDQDIFQDVPRETARKQKSRESKKDAKKDGKSAKDSGFAVVPAVSDADALERVKDAVELELSRDKATISEVQAMGSLLVNKGTRMALIDGAYNRRTFDDVDLPSWFTEDEKKHSNYELPVSKELMKRYKAKLYELKNRPIRKVLEARGRKKLRMERKLKSILPRVEALQDSETGKPDRAKKLLRKVKSAVSDKREKVYVVSRRGGSGPAASSGGKGSRKVVKAVDKRMKKDNVRQKRKPRSKSRKARIH